MIFYFIPMLVANAQPAEPSVIVSGPMLGGVELRSVIIWLQVSAVVRSVSLEYWKEDEHDKRKQKHFEGRLGS